MIMTLLLIDFIVSFINNNNFNRKHLREIRYNRGLINLIDLFTSLSYGLNDLYYRRSVMINHASKSTRSLDDISTIKTNFTGLTLISIDKDRKSVV